MEKTPNASKKTMVKDMCFYQIFKPKNGFRMGPGCGMCSVCQTSPENKECGCYVRVRIEVLEVERNKYQPMLMQIFNEAK